MSDSANQGGPQQGGLGGPPNLPLPPIPAVTHPPQATAKAAVPKSDRLGRFSGNSASTAQVADKLKPEQRRWSDNVLRALKLKSKGSQARMIAGAVATAEQIGQARPADAQNAKALRDVVLGAGDPPWTDMSRAMAAGGAKAKLDLLSIPPQTRQLQPLSANKGVNTAFWVNRRDADGQTRASFLCKSQAADPTQEVDGIPLGGEVVREAMSARAAQAFAAQTGIDIGMPETHMVTLDAAMLPPANRKADGSASLCSIQEARPNSGDLKGLSARQKAELSADAVAALAMFDTFTLNTDRHAGNVLMGDDGKLVPIDQGASFVEDSDEGIERIRDRMGTPHNALLSLPGAHKPMSKSLCKKLAALDPQALADGLRQDRDVMATQHGAAADLLDDASIEWSRRAAYVVKAAAKHKPPMTPASVQLLMGTYAEFLLKEADPQRFESIVATLLDRECAVQALTETVCLAGGAEFGELAAKVEALGWATHHRGDQPRPDQVTNPAVMLKIVAGNLQPGTTSFPTIREAPSDVGALKATWIRLQEETIRMLADSGPPGGRDRLLKLLAKVKSSGDKRSRELSRLAEAATNAALTHQQARLTTLLTSHGLKSDNFAARQATLARNARDPRGMRKEIDAFAQYNNITV